MDRVRNFCIVAHIDHGKSTLADRLIQRCGGVADREFRDQILDSLDIERERGITIKSNTITLLYDAKDGHRYQLNLIDTPGHVDFSHEVRRSLMACEGALLLIDAAQGVEAQTVANLYLAMEHDLEILPVVNKIDLPAADIERVQEEIDSDLGLDPFEIVAVSAKTGAGIDDLLEAIVARLPAPRKPEDDRLRCLVFDAQYDAYRGVVLFCRVMSGELHAGQEVRFMHTDAVHTIEEVGTLQLRRQTAKTLAAGSVGYVIAGIKTISDIAIGDTMTDARKPVEKPIPGYREAKSVVFSSMYPVSSAEYEDLGRALEKLKLNDAALTFQKDSSSALGFGFRCGFLGLLHLDVVQQRLEREYDLALVLSAPSVQYNVTLNDGTEIEVDNPSLYPDPTEIDHVEEPFIKASIMVPERYVGAVMELVRDRRGEKLSHSYLSVGRVELTSELPLAEVLYDFYDRLKTVTQGYGSFDYEMLDYRVTDLVKVDILVNGEPVDALSQLVHREKSRARALRYCDRLKDTIPRQQFKIAIQGAIGGQIIARSTINAYRKDVTAKCYGGDISRKRKLLEKQKEGKKRMKMVGNIEIPQEAFVSVLRSDDG